MEEVIYYGGRFVTLAVGLGAVWFAAPTIARSRFARRVDSARELAVSQWLALAILVLLPMLWNVLSRPLYIWSATAMLMLGPLETIGAAWLPCLLAIAGGLLVVTPALGARLSAWIIGAGILASLGWVDLFTPGVRSLFLLEAWWSVTSLSSGLVWVLAPLWLGGATYALWARRQAELLGSEPAG